MNNKGKIVTHIEMLLKHFEPHCSDRTTITKLNEILQDRGQWHKAHRMHGTIRDKTIQAEGDCSTIKMAQCQFEEICAKTIYNLSNESAPFDPDSPYWIIPNAFALARELGIDHERIIEVISA